jgi:NADH-quinone oxidoreductase subunit L
MDNLIYLIPLFPLLAFALITLFANKSKQLSGLIAIAAIAGSWVISWLVFFQAWTDHHFYENPIGLPLISIPTGASVLELGFRVDSLTAIMLFMVPFVCLMIFIYAWGYMGIGKKVAGGFDAPQTATQPAGDGHGGHDEHGGHGGGRGWPAGPENVDPLASRFFAYISLFACGMLGLVLADNLLLLFVFWEIMGLCSRYALQPPGVQRQQGQQRLSAGGRRSAVDRAPRQAVHPRAVHPARAGTAGRQYLLPGRGRGRAAQLGQPG